MSAEENLRAILNEFREDVRLLLRSKAEIEEAIRKKESVILNLEAVLQELKR